MGFIYEISGKYRENRELHKKKRLVPTLDYFFCAMGTDEPDYRYIIGKMVKGRIDRPLGSSHPWYPELIYSLNYGYIEGVFAGDGEEQDVYIFGADKPLTYFEGKVIAVWHRFDDTEDKWIVSLDESDIPEEKILGDIAFQEQFFLWKMIPIM